MYTEAFRQLRVDWNACVNISCTILGVPLFYDPCACQCCDGAQQSRDRGVRTTELAACDVKLSAVGEVPEALLIYQQVLMESVDDWPMAKFNSRHWG